jgi:hypothetical protein
MNRYSCRLTNAEFNEDPAGAWVHFDDVAALTAKVAAMESDWLRLHNSSDTEMLDGDLARELARKWIPDADKEPT